MSARRQTRRLRAQHRARKKQQAACGNRFFYHSHHDGANEKQDAARNSDRHRRDWRLQIGTASLQCGAMRRHLRAVDVAGVGLNATDTIIRLPHYPALDSKVEIRSVNVHAGGQVASAIVACRRWGLKVRYAGKVGDDEAGRFQIAEMKREKVKAHWVIAKGQSSQIAYILVDAISGERTVLWKRDLKISLQPQEVKEVLVLKSKVLLVDGHDPGAARKAAKLAKRSNTFVVGDFDNLYAGVEGLLEYVDFPITSRDFPRRLTGEKDLLKSLPLLFERFGCRACGATIGRLGVIVWDGVRFHLCPGYRVKAIDTTGAGDIFHGAFAFGLVQRCSMDEILEFSCAAAALNCTALGARGGIASLREIQKLRAKGARSERAYQEDKLQQAARRAVHDTSKPAKFRGSR